MREAIQKRQNEENMLKTQYTARSYYNSAELYGILAWLCCLLSAIALVLLEKVSFAYQLTVPIVVDLAALFFSKMQGNYVEKAAVCREIFDAYVLGINDNYKRHEKEGIIGDAIEYCERHQKESSVQIANTGFDKPPGVKDWYDLRDDKDYHSNDEVVFECQKQNAWWDERLSNSRIKVFVTIIVIMLIILTSIIVTNHNYMIIRAVLSSALIVKSIERIIAEYKFAAISHEVNGALTVMNVNLDSRNIEVLQELLNTKRKFNVVGINWIHKQKANSLSNTNRSRKNI